ncbi:MAG: hypothetical protein GXO64_02780 [Candidatus Micrarchaeota archaeon]|nr:hypothetical protein [Candidatus Micrarchaeota archaeon]
MNKEYFACKICGLYYEDKKWARRCEEWCSKYNSCNIEITSHAVKKT